MRQSCLLTLKKKYRLKNIAEAKKWYTRDVSLAVKNKPTVKLITKKEIIKIPNIFAIHIDPITGLIERQVNWEITLNKRL